MTSSYDSYLTKIKQIISTFNSSNLSNLPKHYSFKQPVDEYADALTIFYIQNPNLSFPVHSLTFILLYHPFLISLFQLNHTIDSWNILRLKLLEEINNNFSSLPQAKSIIQILSTEPPKQTTISSLQLFHYLIGFYFKSNTISKTSSELQPTIDSLIAEQQISAKHLVFILVNASYNVRRRDSIICYHDIPPSKAKILNESTIKNFESFSLSPCSQYPGSPFSIYSSSWQKLSDLPSDFTHSLVLINYCDSKDVPTNHFTIAYYGKGMFLDRQTTFDFISFKILKTIPLPLISFYLTESYYNRICTDSYDIDQLKRSYTQFLNTISEVFNTTSSISDFRSKLISSVKVNHSDLIPSSEIKWFALYLTKLNKLSNYDLSSVLSFVSSYIYPDLLTSTESL